MTDSSARPTLEQVAARAGVGRGTVSRVVNGSPRVSAQAREAVLKAIDELGYVPNRAARALVTRRTDTVALVVAESDQRLFDEPYFAGIIRGIGNGLADTGLQLLLALARPRPSTGGWRTTSPPSTWTGCSSPPCTPRTRCPPSWRPTGSRPSSAAARRGCRRSATSTSTTAAGPGRPSPTSSPRGRRRIATIAGPQDMGVGIDRLAGYRDALAEAGLPEYVEYGDFGQASGIAATERLLAAEPELDAVFAADDPMAFGALRVLRQHGRRVPDDVAVIGFDDSADAPLADPPLTTVHQSPEEMGREMARLLVSRIRGETVDDPVVIMRPHLVVRESA